MRLLFFDAKPYAETDPVRSLMWGALAHPSDEMLDHLLHRYSEDEDLLLLGAMDAEQSVQGIIGLRRDGEGTATLLHLRVADDAQRRGVGRALVRKAIALESLTALSGRSPEHLLDFFSAIGFTHWLIGEKPPGSNWYGVRWSRSGDESLHS